MADTRSEVAETMCNNTLDTMDRLTAEEIVQWWSLYVDLTTPPPTAKIVFKGRPGPKTPYHRLRQSC